MATLIGLALASVACGSSSYDPAYRLPVDSKLAPFQAPEKDDILADVDTRVTPQPEPVPEPSSSPEPVSTSPAPPAEEPGAE